MQGQGDGAAAVRNMLEKIWHPSSGNQLSQANDETLPEDARYPAGNRRYRKMTAGTCNEPHTPKGKGSLAFSIH